MVGAFVLLQLDGTHISITALPKLVARTGCKRSSQVLKEVISCWTLMAQTNAACFVSNMQWDDYRKVDSIIRQLAAQLLKVCKCVELGGLIDFLQIFINI